MSDPDKVVNPPKDQKRGSRQGKTSSLRTNEASDSVHGRIPAQTARPRSGDRQSSARATNPTDSKEQGDTSVRTARKTSDNRDKSRERKDTRGVLIVKHLERTWIIYAVLILVVAYQQYQLDRVWSTITTLDTTGAAIDLSPFMKVSQYETSKKEVTDTLESIKENLREQKQSIDNIDLNVVSAKSDFSIKSAELKKQTDTIPILDKNLETLTDRLQDYDEWILKVEKLSDYSSQLSKEFIETQDAFENFKKTLVNEARALRSGVEDTRNEYHQFLKDMNENHIPRLEHAKQELDELNVQFEEIKGKVNEVLMPNAFNKGSNKDADPETEDGILKKTADETEEAFRTAGKRKRDTRERHDQLYQLEVKMAELEIKIYEQSMRHKQEMFILEKESLMQKNHQDSVLFKLKKELLEANLKHAVENQKFTFEP